LHGSRRVFIFCNDCGIGYVDLFAKQRPYATRPDGAPPKRMANSTSSDELSQSGSPRREPGRWSCVQRARSAAIRRELESMSRLDAARASTQPAFLFLTGWSPVAVEAVQSEISEARTFAARCISCTHGSRYWSVRPFFCVLFFLSPLFFLLFPTDRDSAHRTRHVQTQGTCHRELFFVAPSRRQTSYSRRATLTTRRPL